MELRRLGQSVNCIFCQHQFVATNIDSRSAALDDPLHYWIHFTADPINEIIETQTEFPNIIRHPK